MVKAKSSAEMSDDEGAKGVQHLHKVSTTKGVVATELLSDMVEYERKE